MNVRFAACVHELEPKFAALLQANPFKICNTPTNIPKSGIYLFSENTTHLYVGRSANIRKQAEKPLSRAREYCGLCIPSRATKNRKSDAKL